MQTCRKTSMQRWLRLPNKSLQRLPGDSAHVVCRASCTGFYFCGQQARQLPGTARLQALGRIKMFLRVLNSLAAAIIAPAIIIVAASAVATISSDDSFAWMPILDFSGLVVFIAAGHVIVLGLPLFIVLYIQGWIRWWTSSLSGFILGCVPTAVRSWPYRYTTPESDSSHWDGEKMVSTMIGGIPTAHGNVLVTLNPLQHGSFPQDEWIHVLDGFANDAP